MPRDAEPPDPYLYGLAALGRRELTERQLRERLRRVQLLGAAAALLGVALISAG